VLPYFKKLEASWRGTGPFHGTQGPVANVPVYGHDMHYLSLQQAALNAGLQVSHDHNGSEQEGISVVEINTARGRRASTARSYLHPVRKARQNLHILTKAHTTRVLFEGTRAVGVEFLRRGKLERVRADREIILSAGTYGTPQILMLSGVGPADHLRSLGIDVVHDLSGVGENLHEHPNLLNIYRTNGRIGLSRHLRLDRATWAVARWALFGRGPFAMAGTTANIFMRSHPDLERPDIQIIAMPVHQHAKLWFPGFTEPPVYAFTARVGILHALSRGWVRLRSANPLDLPRIQFNMLTEQADMDSMVQAVKLSRTLFGQDPMRRLIAEELLPGAHFQSDAELAQAIREQAEHRHHACGTCRMGTGDGAVVDAQLRVMGVQGLRIADASVMPEDPSGNTNVPTMMIGEKAADLIKGQTLPPEEF
jgi:choline dehydrogenase